MNVVSNPHPSIASIYPSRISQSAAATVTTGVAEKHGRGWISMNFFTKNVRTNCKNLQYFSLLNLHPPSMVVICLEKPSASRGAPVSSLQEQRFSSRHSNSGITAAGPPPPACVRGRKGPPISAGGQVGLNKKLTLFDSLILSKREELGRPFKPSSWRCSVVS